MKIATLAISLLTSLTGLTQPLGVMKQNYLLCSANTPESSGYTLILENGAVGTPTEITLSKAGVSYPLAQRAIQKATPLSTIGLPEHFSEEYKGYLFTATRNHRMDFEKNYFVDEVALNIVINYTELNLNFLCTEVQ